jgi:predicted amidohydrolase YtcJ
MKTLLINGKVWLYKNYFANAIGFDSSTGRIDFIGSNSEAVDKSTEYDEMIDVKGRLIMSAFMEGHCHLIKGSIVNSELNLRDISTKQEFIDRIGKYADDSEGWIQGGYFADSNMKEDFIIDRNFLDEVCPDRPMFVSRFDYHSAIVNSKAIEETGLESKRGEFPKSDLVENESGELTGEIKEDTRTYVWKSIPKLSVSKQAEALKVEISRLHSLGITFVSDITLPEDLDVYSELLNKKELDLFVDSRLPFQEIVNIDEHQRRFKDYKDKIKFLSLKAFYDGSLSSETAYFNENYTGKDHNGSRTDFVNSGEFLKYADIIDGAGYRMSVHAIGDKAVTELLDLNEYLIENFGIKDRRFRIEHAQHVIENDLDRFKKLNVIASVQPWHLFSDAKTAMAKVKYPETTHNYKRLYDRGVCVCFGTDFPIVGEDPLETIYYAMTRQAEGMDGEFYPEMKMSLEDCLTCYTVNNAFASGEDKRRGKLKEGYIADVIVIDDLFEFSPSDITHAKVAMTFANGKRVY